MNKVTAEILEKRIVMDAAGRPHPLRADTPRAQGEFLARLIAEIDAMVCVEVGLAHGISSLFIAEAIAGKKAPRLISIDPFQSEWHNIGLLNLERAGYSGFVEFHREMSHETLPRLLAQGERVDFAYVDASKVFDVVMVHAYYLTRLLRIGGLMVFDDCTWPGVKKIVRCLARWPHLEVVARHNMIQSSLPRRTVSRLLQFAPKKDRIFSDSLINLDETLRINAHCVAFKKLAEDQRHWAWHREF